MKKKLLTQIILGMTVFSLAGCATTQTPPVPSAPHTKAAVAARSSYNPNKTGWQANTSADWERLKPLSVQTLQAMQTQTTDATERGWIELVLIAKEKNLNNQLFATSLLSWRQRNQTHPANQFIPRNGLLKQLRAQTPPQQIAVLLPQTGTYAKFGAAVREGFLSAYYAHSTDNTTQRVKFYDTAQATSMAEIYQQAIQDGADFVVGPLTKESVQALSALPQLKVPTLALNYSEPKSLPNNLYEYGLLASDEVEQMAIKASGQGLKHAIIIAPKNAWGQQLAAQFSKQWKTSGGDVVASWYYGAPQTFSQDVARLLRIDPFADRKLARASANNKDVLSKQRRQDFDVVFLFAQPKAAHAIVPLLRFYYVTDTPVFATSSVYSGKIDPVRDADLNGITLCEMPASLAFGNATTSRLQAVGQDTYLLSQSMTRLAQLGRFPLYGETGELTLTPERQVHRSLPCMQIKNGLIA